MNDFQRLDSILKYYKLSVVDFAKQLNRSTNFYYNIKNNVAGRNNINNKLALDICQVFKEINLDWLLKGEGKMLKDQTAGATAGASEPPKRTPNTSELLQRIVDLQDNIIRLQEENNHLRIENQQLRNNAN